MSIRVALNHVTSYEYERPVVLSPQIIRLRPAAHTRTPIPSYSLRITPEKHFINWQQDPFGNFLARVVFPDRVKKFCVEVDLTAVQTVINPFDFFLEPSADEYPFVYDKAALRDLKPYLEETEEGEKFARFISRIPRGKQRTIDFLVDLNRRVQKAVDYVIRMEPGVQSAEETLALAKGSCRDSAWLLVQTLRHLGIAARFVSGYLIQLTSDVKPLDGPEGPSVDFTDLHAWAEAYLPGAGWVGMDPTSGLLTGEGHIPLAATPDPQGAAPITGAVEKCESQFSFHMSVRRVHEDPRVTKPYSDNQWEAIERVGHNIDTRMKAAGIRLTMGGEPTFVSIDDYDAPEWNTEALGARKRQAAGILIRRLRNRFGPEGFLHFGQGKWYPGEQLPRWALANYWRRDGEPLWTQHALIASDNADYGHGAPHARNFIRLVAERLAVDAEHAIPGFEDAFYYLWKERRLPLNVDPYKSNLADKTERERLSRVFEKGLESIVGYALPLGKGPDGWAEDWQSGKWFLRDERMRLIPGDSPMGFRLPLDSLPWAAEEDLPYLEAQDPSGPRVALPRRDVLRRAQASRRSTVQQTGVDQRVEQVLPGDQQSAPWIIRTALCVEPRGGVLHVFLPPVRTLEDYLEILAAVEDTAAELQTPVRIEGYTPPPDPRLNVIKATPDPGVIEVNVHAARDWDELKAITLGLYEDARHARLGTEKFEIDGRHTGTGGGNHIVLGGETTADSPILRRPDLLGSLVAYWHNHPALSYLFSSTFIGPTSQAPRVDEARNDAVYELEIALAQLANAGTNNRPWLVDRVLRHILTDLTGNTHRAEFCIDKLYSPDSPSGRLGLLELRAFEMPPHARMSLVQALLLRTLVLRFWEAPYKPERLARWGTDLHDRFVLPHFVQEDLRDVIEECRAAGLPLEDSWFDPHIEFRFPRFGTAAVRNIELELRGAIEPWHVLGEEATSQGTARYVDSSVERLQVKVRGLTGERHALTCNGVPVPLHPTGVVGEYVAGIRYRAWQPPSCLHPMIGVHTPLVFDVVDTWLGRSLGGCQYHVMHPGGRNYDTRPVNANEAEARRVARFFRMGHTPGQSAFPLPPPTALLSAEHPVTLDLRRF